MGVPMDRSNRVFGHLSTFEKVFPTVESVKVEFTEYDFTFDVRSGHWDIRYGGVMPCGNPACRRGGYEVDGIAQSMVREGVMEKEVALDCHGDEGSPKGRKPGRRCERKIEGRITVTLKPDANEGTDNDMNDRKASGGVS